MVKYCIKCCHHGVEAGEHFCHRISVHMKLDLVTGKMTYLTCRKERYGKVPGVHAKPLCGKEGVHWAPKGSGTVTGQWEGDSWSQRMAMAGPWA